MNDKIVIKVGLAELNEMIKSLKEDKMNTIQFEISVDSYTKEINVFGGKLNSNIMVEYGELMELSDDITELDSEGYFDIDDTE